MHTFDLDMEDLEVDELPEEEVELMDVGDLDVADEELDQPPVTPAETVAEPAVPAPTDDEIMELFKNNVLMAKVRATQQVATFLRYVVEDVRLLLQKEPTQGNLAAVIERLGHVQPQITAVHLAINADTKNLGQRIKRALGIPHVPQPRQTKVRQTQNGENTDLDFEALGINPFEPTTASPGSEGKILMLAARYAAGAPFWLDGDAQDQGPGHAMARLVRRA